MCAREFVCVRVRACVRACVFDGILWYKQVKGRKCTS